MNEKTGELVDKDQTHDLEQITAAIGALVNPLAQAQSDTTQQQLAAQTEQLKIRLDADNERSKRSFRIAYLYMGIMAVTVWGLLLMDLHDVAINALYFFLGGGGGFMAGRYSPQHPTQ